MLEENIMARFKVFGKEGFFSRFGKKNLVILLAILAIGAAVWLNYDWIYQGIATIGFGDNNMTDQNKENPDGAKTEDPASVYFTSAAISRQQSRDEALAVLKLVTESPDALEATKTEALTDIAVIAKEIENEINVETLVKAKGFEDCLAVMEGDAISIVVLTEEPLIASEIAQISAIVYEQTGITPANCTIIEK